MTKRSKVLIIVFASISVLVTVLLMACILLIYIGPVYGVVVDADTGKPIEGATVAIFWPIGAGNGTFETLTDSTGRYHFRGHLLIRDLLLFQLSTDEKFLVYKDGYAVYRAMGPEGPGAGSYIGPKQEWVKKNNRVLLQELPCNDAYYAHENMGWMMGYAVYGPEMMKVWEAEQKKALGEQK